jgi:hypothetical protein
MKIQCVYTSLHLWLVAAALAAMPVWADGQLDTSFGTNGIVKIAFPPASQGFYLHRIAVVNGTLEAVGYDDVTLNCEYPPSWFPIFTIVRLSLDGVVIGSPHSFTQQAVQCISDIVIDSATGDIYAIGGNTVVWFDSSGNLIATYTVTAPPPNEAHCNAGRALIDNQRRIVAACAVWGPSGEQMAALLRLSFRSGQLTGGLTHALPWQLSTSGWSEGPMALTQDPGSGAYYATATSRTCKKWDPYHASYCRGGDPEVARFHASTGTLDLNYVLAQGPYDVSAITMDDSGDVLIGGGNESGNNWKVARLQTLGGAETFGSNGTVEVGSNPTDMIDESVDIHTDRTGRVYVLTPLSQLYRLNPDGSTDATFSSNTDIEALNGLSSDWISMEFADSSQSSAYLVGGAHACSSGCTATGAIIAKVLLNYSPVKESTTATLTSSSNTIVVGQTVTFSATVTGANSTGTVTFSDGSTTLATVSLTSGAAQYNTSALAVGTHSISAAYSGDSNNAASTSPVVAETVVKQPTTTALTSSSNTIVAGQAVTFSATVTGTNSTGTVTFSDGSTTLATVSLTSGRAGYSTSALAVGKHSISAAYSGDSNNAANTSAVMTETVNAADQGSGDGGGGGSFALMDLFVLLCGAVGRCFRRRAAVGMQ